MKIRSLLALMGLAVGFTVPTLAQEQDVVTPEIRQQIEAAVMKFQDAYNKHDPIALAALYTEDGVEVRGWVSWPTGYSYSSRHTIEKMFASDPLASGAGQMVIKVVQLYPIGSSVCEIEDSLISGSTYRAVVIYVRTGDTWLRRSVYVNH
jgi:ketosteroid isomerase-like protein